MNSLRAALFSPYIPTTFGGGEKYLFDFAQVLQEKYQVDIAISSQYRDRDLASVQKEYEKFLGRSLANLNFVFSPLFWSNKISNKLWWTKQYDVLFYITDGSFFPSLAKKNVCHIQVPLLRQQISFLEKIKLLNWRITTNSKFTAEVVTKHWQVNVDMVQEPMIDLPRKFDKDNKEKIILHVGRFFPHLHSKRQDILIEAWQKLHKLAPNLLRGWRLVLVGSADDHSYTQKIIKLAHGLPVDIINNASRQEVLQLLRQASIYWHATGYGIDVSTHPAMVEHFGISTVEAMSQGCVPVVIGKGGQVEILGSQLQNLTWQTTEECAQITASLLANKDEMANYAKLAVERSKKYNQTAFANKTWQVIE